MRTELEIIDVNSGRYRNTSVRNRSGGVQRRKRKVQRRKRKLLRLYRTVACLLCVAIILSATVIIKQLLGNRENHTYQEITENYRPNRPREIEPSEAAKELEALLMEYPEFSVICENAKQYPEKLLAALCNNPEMYEFVKDYPKSDGSVT